MTHDLAAKVRSALESEGIPPKTAAIIVALREAAEEQDERIRILEVGARPTPRKRKKVA